MKKIVLILLSLVMLAASLPVMAEGPAWEPLINMIDIYENCGITLNKNGYIYGVPEKTTWQTAVKRFISESPVITNYAPSSDYVVTGTDLRCGTAAAKFIVSGDVNSDGKITSTDYLRIKKSFAVTGLLSEIEKLAADINSDSKLTSIDYIAVRNYLKGKYEIVPPLPEVPETYEIVVLTPSEKDVHIANESVRGIMNSTEFTRESLAPFADGNVDRYASDGVSFKWINRVADNRVELSLNSNLSNAKTYTVKGHDLTVPDLLAGTKYYYRITSGGNTTGIRSFITANEPRTITIDGVSNCRDIGGYISKDGTKRVKQGILFRTAQLNNITEQGVSDMTEKYGIKTEIDLSGGGNTSALLKNKVNQEFWSIKSYGQITNTSLQENLRHALEVFADSSNYPILFHCMAGRDRTGTISAILLALAGVDELTIYREYNLTWTSWWGNNDDSSPEELSMMLYTLLSLFEDEADLKVAMENFLVDEIGVSMTTVKKIEANITEDVPKY